MDIAEIKEFRDLLLEEVKIIAEDEMIGDEEALVKSVTDTLKDAEEIYDFTPCYYEGVGKRGKKIKINGHYYDDTEESLSVFVCCTINFGEIEIINNTDIEKEYSKALAFIEESSYILENGEESAEGYGFAYDVKCKLLYRINKIKIFVITDGRMSNSVKNIENFLLNGVTVEIHVWDVERIYQIHQSKNFKEEVCINLKEFGDHGIPCLRASTTTEYDAYLCNVSGLVLAKLYNKYGSRLLEGNVRSFLQIKGKVNKGIRNTILNNPAKFFAYNNGIAATATDVVIEKIEGLDYIIEIKGLQIVNGGQTTVSLAMAYLNDKKDGSEEQIGKIFVPMKLSRIDQEKAQELIPNISRYANTQNKVSESDLWSNHPFHVRMEDISRRSVTPAIGGKQYGTFWYYERANGQYKQETYKGTQSEKRQFETKYPHNQMFKKEDLAKFWNIMQLHPEIASAGKQKSFEKFARHINAQWDTNSEQFNKGFFEDIVSLAIIYKETDKIIKSQEWFNSYKANINAYTISRLLLFIKEELPERTYPFHIVWSKQSVSIAFREEIAKLSRKVYEILIAQNRTVENVTEWAKRPECWDRVKKILVEPAKEFIDYLPYKDEIKLKNKDDKKDQKETDKVNVLTFVYNYGSENWRALLNWDDTHKILNLKERDFVKTATLIENGKIPSDAQCSKIVEALEKAREEGFAL